MTGGATTVAGEMIPVVRSGSRVPFELDPAATNSTVAVGAALTPTSDGYYGANGGGLSTQVGIAASYTGSGQVGSAELGR